MVTDIMCYNQNEILDSKRDDYVWYDFCSVFSFVHDICIDHDVWWSELNSDPFKLINN